MTKIENWHLALLYFQNMKTVLLLSKPKKYLDLVFFEIISQLDDVMNDYPELNYLQCFEPKPEQEPEPEPELWK
jgi:hypothetical protein